MVAHSSYISLKVFEVPGDVLFALFATRIAKWTFHN